MKSKLMELGPMGVLWTTFLVFALGTLPMLAVGGEECEVAEEASIDGLSRSVGEAMVSYAADHPGYPLCISHRGNTDNAPENSLLSILDATRLQVDGREARADGVEFDIRHTQDGIPILMHDATLHRTAVSRPGKNCRLTHGIATLTWDHIREHCQLKHTPEQVARIEAMTDDPLERERLLGIPLLSDALDVVKDSGLKVFAEFKSAPNYLSARQLRQHFQGHIEDLRVISFNNRHFRFLERSDGEDEFWDQVKYLQLDLFSPSHIATKLFNFFGIYPRRRERYGANVSMGAAMSDRFENFSNELSVWTVNSFAELATFFQRPVEYITTDNIQDCLRIQARHRTPAMTPSEVPVIPEVSLEEQFPDLQYH